MLLSTYQMTPDVLESTQMEVNSVVKEVILLNMFLLCHNRTNQIM